MSTEKTFMDTPLPGMASEILSVDVKVNTTERSAYRPHEQEAKDMKRKGIHGLFKRTWKHGDAKAGAEKSAHLKHNVENKQKGRFKSFYETTFDVVGVERTGLVFDGIRKSDGHKVSVKCIENFEKLTFYYMASYLKPLINEVAMICLMQQPPISPYVIRMSEWFERLGGAVIVLEDPRPCSLLSDLIDRDAFDEKTARILMHQAVLAAKHCIAHGVFYAELNPRNILLNTSTWELKLIDFSCALPYTAYEYWDTDYRGNRDYASPECLMDGNFRAVSKNIWQLGLLLTELVFGCYYTDKPKKLPDLSEDCIKLILWCRHDDPERRPTFDQILQHRWFTLD